MLFSPIPSLRLFVYSLLTTAFFAASAFAQNEKPYLIIPDTTSPDGRYAVGWGVSTGMLDVSNEDALIESLDYNNVENYLIDLNNGNQIAILDSAYFGTETFSKNHGYLNVTWREDSRAVIVSESGKWETMSASVLHIVDPADEWDPCSDVIPVIQAMRRVVKTEIEKQFPGRSQDFAITVTPIRWADDQSVQFEVIAEIPKSEGGSFERSLTLSVPSPDLVSLSSGGLSNPAARPAAPSADFLITSSSAGSVQLGMSVEEAMATMPSATFTRTSDGEGIALILVTLGGKEQMLLHAGEWDPDAPIDPTKKIEMIDVINPSYATMDGVRVGTPLSNIPASFGQIEEILMSEIEAREYIRFSNQPSGLHFQAWGETGAAGAYSPNDNITTKFTPGAQIHSIEITGPEIMNDGNIGGVKIDMDQADLLASAEAMNWGEVYKGTDEIWEAFGQAVQTWLFPNEKATFDMISDEIGGNKSVFSITIQSPSRLRTGRGIGIGTPKQTVLEAYRDYPTSDEGMDGFFGDADAHLVGSIYGGMIFYFENGVVSEIFLGAAAE